MREVGSAWVDSLVNPVAGNEIHLARITGVEVIAAITRRQHSGSLTAAHAALMRTQFRQEFATEYQIVEVTQALAARAMDLAELHGLRGYDAVQLAAILQLNTQRLARAMSPLTLVSADAELNAAAVA